MRIQQILCSLLAMTIGMTVETYDWWNPKSFSDFAVPIGMSGFGGLAAHYGDYNPILGGAIGGFTGAGAGALMRYWQWKQLEAMQEMNLWLDMHLHPEWFDKEKR